MINWAVLNAPKNPPTSSIVTYVDFATQGPKNWDCTNFVSHAMLQGGAVRTSGWYFYSMENRIGTWSDVNLLHNFLVRTTSDAGPKGERLTYAVNSTSLGDIVQIMYDGESGFTHSTMVTSKTTGSSPNVFITSRSASGTGNYDVNLNILTRYPGEKYRLIHLTTYIT